MPTSAPALVIGRAAAMGWGAMAGGVVLAAIAPAPVQLGIAALSIGTVGMAHGASDLAIVAKPRRPLFLLLYAAVALLCLLWWTWWPAVALPAFLAVSIIHFGVEDAPPGAPGERIVRGISLVTTPAALHPAGFGVILTGAGGAAPWIAAGLPSAVLAGAATAAAAIAIGIARGDRRLVGGTAALLLLPPLIGFAIGFLMLHALPQTVLRRQRLHLPDMRAYLRATAPVMALALVGVAGIGLLLWTRDGIGTRALFAGIAALALPHLLVTPWFDAGVRAEAGRPREVASSRAAFR